MTSKQPFFSQFVEGQELSENEIKQVAGGGVIDDIREVLDMITRKAPSDNDENFAPLDFSSFTKKYPSDNEEG